MKETKFKNTEIGLIPVDWEVKKLGEIAVINVNETSIPNRFYYIDLESVKDGIYTKSNMITKENAPSRAQRTIKCGDILYQTVRPYQKNNLLVTFDPVDYVASTGYAVIRCINGNVPSYVFNCLLQDTFVSVVLDNCTGTSYPAINPNKLSQLQIPLPPLPEQRRIAEVLSEADELIKQWENVIAKKRDIKTGTMQLLLTGKKRLNGFKDEWVEKKVSEIAKVGRGRVISQIEINNSITHKYPVYSSQTLNDGIMGYIDTYDFEGEYISWTTDGVNAGTVFYRNGKFNCTNVCGLLKLDNNTFDFRFIALRLQLETYNYVSTNLANPKLMNNVMKSIPITFPPTLTEQRAIAEILSDMDDEIRTLEQKVEKLRNIKSGMMQQLLSGKIRLVGDEADNVRQFVTENFGPMHKAAEGKAKFEENNGQIRFEDWNTLQNCDSFVNYLQQNTDFSMGDINRFKNEIVYLIQNNYLEKYKDVFLKEDCYFDAVEGFLGIEEIDILNKERHGYIRSAIMHYTAYAMHKSPYLEDFFEIKHSQSLCVEFPDGKTIHYANNIYSYFKALEAIGFERVSDLNITYANENIVMPSELIKDAYSDFVTFGSKWGFNNLLNHSTRAKKLRDISDALGLGLKVSFEPIDIFIHKDIYFSRQHKLKRI